MIADSKNRVGGEAFLSPDFAKFDQYLEEFKATAQDALGDRVAVTPNGAVEVEGVDERSPVPGQFPG